MLVSGGARTLVAVDHPVRPVDTTGAGDSFNGAYLAARLTGLTPVAAVRHAQAVSAQVVTERGALLPPDRLRAAYGTV